MVIVLAVAVSNQKSIKKGEMHLKRRILRSKAFLGLALG
jgi:hypothetical protein